MGESPGLQEGGQESDNTIPNVKLDLHYVDPRLVAMYEDANGRGPDTEFFLGLASQVEAETILDLGCGTGLLTRELASKHRRVVGVDPSAAMLDYGKRQPGAERVEWMDVVSVGQGRVVFEGYNVFRATNETLVIRSELRFRTEAEVRSSLERCGFTVEQVFGDWNSGPVTSQSQVLVFVARR